MCRVTQPPHQRGRIAQQLSGSHYLVRFTYDLLDKVFGEEVDDAVFVSVDPLEQLPTPPSDT
eukprot:CAMPEP_0175822420 /NCGR_PEP_ID=MMETSP0107_2-20121207/9668_1 /TAXON_ID=195067 ORGANISM="Goniomonas pacifica, Strain CCMP1869" /NCGR_SAMPLE_ID=MMETSP0107_2 /ASSEMBLY_ACC=CAM_ASM_000203 /LENGTH=61 /DNA_ID=CAMNT_0017134883 /DNA_START=98 /DNA_END=279 /DNA_ORIENTATION=+